MRPSRAEGSTLRAENIVSSLCQDRDAIFSRSISLFEGASEKLRNASLGPGPFARQHKATLDRFCRLRSFHEKMNQELSEEAPSASSGELVASVFRRSMDMNWASVAITISSVAELEQALVAFEQSAKDFSSVFYIENGGAEKFSVEKPFREIHRRSIEAFDVGHGCQRTMSLLEDREHLYSSINSIRSSVSEGDNSLGVFERLSVNK